VIYLEAWPGTGVGPSFDDWQVLKGTYARFHLHRILDATEAIGCEDTRGDGRATALIHGLARRMPASGGRVVP